jgi:hypothetical protein
MMIHKKERWKLSHKRKGQVTVFIILGILILLIIALAIYLMSSSKEKKFSPSDILVSEKFLPVQDYVQQCMNQITSEAVYRIGQHGGYIDPNDAVLSGIQFDMKPFTQYDSDAVFIRPLDKNDGIVYWFYSASARGCENCLVGSLAPSLYDMEQQINHYVSKHMTSCLHNYSTFFDRGYTIVDAHDYAIDTSITDDGVIVLMTGDILAELGEDTEKLEKFYTEIDVPLKKYYDIAGEITIQQIQNNFLENVGLYLLNTYSGMDIEKLPPMHDSTEGYDIKIWSKTSSEQKFRDLLVSYIPALRVPKTRNYFEVNTTNLLPPEAFFYNATRLDLLDNKSLPNTDISFLYMGQDIYFDIQPSDGELIKPETLKHEEFSLFSQVKIINKYDFYYQISYPIVVEIRDEYKPGNVFTFMFGLEGTIKDNLRIKDYLDGENSPIYWDDSFVKITSNFPDPGSISQNLSSLSSQYGLNYSDIINGQGAQYNTPRVSDAFVEMFCNANQRTSGVVKLKVYDSMTQLPLSDVGVRFGCGNFIECDVGSAVFNNTLQESSFQSKLPTCKNGYIKLTKQGYLPKSVAVSTDSTINKNLGSIFMDPIVTKKVSVMMHHVSKYALLDTYGNEKYVSYTLLNGSEPVSVNDSVMITLTRKSLDTLAEPYGSTAVLSQQNGMNEATINLAPGTYSVNIQLLDHNGVIIPKECQTICTEYKTGLFGAGNCKTEKKIPENAIPIGPPAPWGGISFENRTLFYVSPEDLEQDDVLEFHIIRLPDPKCLNDMNDLSNVGKISEKYKTELLPRFI